MLFTYAATFWRPAVELTKISRITISTEAKDDVEARKLVRKQLRRLGFHAKDYTLIGL